MLDPGLYPMHFDFTLPGDVTRSFEQMVLVAPGDFINEAITGVDASTLDPAVTEPENEWLLSLVSIVTLQKYWQSPFLLPVAEPYCLRSMFGNRRTYNNGALYSFHSGLDYGVCSEVHPLDIYAPAAGTVVFAGAKTVRGNVTILDHGWGVYSGIFHQKEILVNEGDFVQAGDLIGQIGDTGRVTGPHLHWEVWVNGFQVDPGLWLDQEYPH
jgi:murein DD-endopeptidase MepM/ murein hydrolase activator NlpD